MGAYDLRTLRQSSAAEVLPAHCGSEAPLGERERIARFVGFAWIAALILIVNACFEQVIALGAVPADYLVGSTMIPAAAREAAIAAMVVVVLTWLTATRRSRLAAIGLTAWAVFSGTSFTNHGWDVGMAMQWVSIGLCALAAFAAALSVRGAFAAHARVSIAAMSIAKPAAC